MAWQLIYTSAPRSLEAGRSGFGTVARHRALSPLLVSAIERASQFSRLPGLDAGRVIFCHRLVALAGTRFHVLSSIRDAGADYTGRTNHLAHHVIADAREIAQLGAHGPSPAEILLAMDWARAWDEPPRYFEAEDELALGALHRSPDGAAWARVAGDANYASLLAAGDASRGAYIIPPAGVDLREIFNESLGLMSDRRWQISLTTSLQPSDEPADFRWIGVEAGSPLRAQIETSGRPILNLTEPSSLPPPPALPTGAAPGRASYIPVAAPAPNGGRTASPGPAPISAWPQSGAVARERGETHAPSEAAAPPSRAPRKWRLFGAVALSLLVLAGLIAGALALLDLHHARTEVAACFEARDADGDFFPEETRRRIAKELVPKSADAPRGQHLAAAASRLAQRLMDAKLGALSSPEADADLDILSNGDGRGLPSDLGKLREAVKDARRLAELPEGFSEASDTAARAQIMNERRAEIERSITQAPLPKKLVKELYANTDRQEAQGLLETLQHRLPPPEGALFRKTVNELAERMTDPTALKTINEVRKALRESAKRDATAAKPDQPPPRTTGPETKRKQAPEKPAVPAEPAIFSFAAQTAGLSIELPYQPQPLRFFLRRPGRSEEELLPFANDPRNGLGADGALFKVRNGKLEPGVKPPEPPYELSIRNQDSVEIRRVFVGPPSSNRPLAPSHSLELKREGNLLKVIGAIPVIAPAEEPVFLLVTPAAFDGSGFISKLELSAGACDLEPSLATLKRRIAAKRAEADAESRQAAQQGAAAKSLDGIRAKARDYARMLKTPEAKKVFDPAAKTGAELVGGFAQALAQEWGNDDASSFDDLWKAGGALADAFPKPDEARARNNALLLEAQKLEQRFRTSQKMDGLSKLRGLCNNLAASYGDVAANDKEIARLTAAAEAAERDAKALEQLPLLTGKNPPPGEYQLIVRLKDFDDVTLYTFVVPQ